jgi:hypothetical protein
MCAKTASPNLKVASSTLLADRENQSEFGLAVLSKNLGESFGQYGNYAQFNA